MHEVSASQAAVVACDCGSATVYSHGAFVHSGRLALLIAVMIGLMGGMANAACIDIAIRACPPGLQGTLMMMTAATFALSSRGGDVLGSWIYGLSPKYGFQYCVIAITVTYRRRPG
jgi:hypothetical protein